ncbi:MAG: PhoH family protein [Agarilytica sp.]
MNTRSEEPALTLELTLAPNDAHHLATLCGQFDSHIKQIEERFNVEILHRGDQFSCTGNATAAECARGVLKALYEEICSGKDITPDDVHLVIQEFSMNAEDKKPSDKQETPSSSAKEIDDAIAEASLIKTKKATVKPRGRNQQGYVKAIRVHDINFGIGPAGTGKTYLAVACAVEALLQDQVERILLVRPAVEAGEKLGFLPGDLAQKVDPYLRPLYDALYEMLGFETVGKLIERSVIEVAPLAYMRGRTLNNSFIILDESQNTTREQMKMFLTRIGFGSTAVITGDPSQIDLPKGQNSGLKHATKVLIGVNGISFTRFGSRDVVRHPIVQRIVEAYEKAEAQRDAPQGQQPH